MTLQLMMLKLMCNTIAKGQLFVTPAIVLRMCLFIAVNVQAMTSESKVHLAAVHMHMPGTAGRWWEQKAMVIKVYNALWSFIKVQFWLQSHSKRQSAQH